VVVQGLLGVAHARVVRRLGRNTPKGGPCLGAEILAVYCPFCLLTLDDAIKTTGNQGKIQVKDTMELIAEAL